ncbi:hypothetical protein [Blastococcus xanthinilyticus]|uniref:hypothetical protein n=1 Tax=Blastococcus xanthinilyticus TaxID=1564164 RepID=UPI001412C964|nr:hypothetical protein [Blastococcus xanthinilyticus]
MIDTGLPIRYHEATVAPAPDAPVWAYLLAEEELHADGRVLGQLFIDAGVNEFQDGKRLHGLTAEQARAFAALLTRAADRADEITGGGAPCR